MGKLCLKNCCTSKIPGDITKSRNWENEKQKKTEISFCEIENESNAFPKEPASYQQNGCDYWVNRPKKPPLSIQFNSMYTYETSWLRGKKNIVSTIASSDALESVLNVCMCVRARRIGVYESQTRVNTFSTIARRFICDAC